MGSPTRLLTVLPLALCLAGCGSSTPATPAATYPGLNGNWEFTGLNATGGVTTPIANFTGSLQSSGPTVTGVFHTIDFSNLTSPCVTLSQDLPATGTVDSAGNLILTMPIGGGTATLKASLNANFQNPAIGSFQIAGGGCAQGLTNCALLQFLPATGTYSGTSTYGSASSSTVIAVLTQYSTPDADGLFPFSGTVTVTGGCSTSFSFSGGAVTGNEVNLLHEATYQSPSGTFLGALLPDASGFQSATIEAYAPGCGALTGPLTRH